MADDSKLIEEKPAPVVAAPTPADDTPRKAVTIQPESVVTITPPVPSTVPAPLPGRTEDKLPSATTPEQDRTTASQRRVNLIWEVTQAVIAIEVTSASVGVAASLSLRGDSGQAAFLLLSNAFFLIVGFYFSRTNHTKTGGVGDTTNKER